jgi:peptide/nickel transport system permease protein
MTGVPAPPPAPAGRASGRRPIPVAVWCAFAVLALVAVLVVFGDLLTPHTATGQNLRARLRPPSWLGGPETYLLGTDRIGRDLFARLVLALRISVAVAVVGTLIGAVVGTTLGFLAAHLRGLFEEAIMMLVDVQASLPFIIVALTLLAFFGNSLTLFVVLMGLNGWEVYARLARGAVLSATAQPYARAVRALGASPLRLYLRHVLPNVANVLIVQFTLNFPQTILLETGLSFLGLGIQPPLTSLGQLLGEGRDFLLNAWWIAVFPGLVIFLVTLSISVVGDWLRDLLDPTLRNVDG